MQPLYREISQIFLETSISNKLYFRKNHSEFNRIQRSTRRDQRYKNHAFYTSCGVCSSIHLSIYLSIRLLCPSKPNAEDDASSLGDRQSRAGCRSRRMQFHVCSFRSFIHYRRHDRFCKTSSAQFSILRWSTASLWCRASISVSTREIDDPQRSNRNDRDISAGSLMRQRSVLVIYPIESLFIFYAIYKFLICSSHAIDFPQWKTTWISVMKLFNNVDCIFVIEYLYMWKLLLKLLLITCFIFY